MKQFDYNGITIKYNEQDDLELLKELLEDMFENYYYQLSDVKEIDFSEFNPDYFYIDGRKYQYEGGRLYELEDEEEELY